MFFLEEISIKALIFIWSGPSTCSELFKILKFIPKEYSYTGFL